MPFEVFPKNKTGSQKTSSGGKFEVFPGYEEKQKAKQQQAKAKVDTVLGGKNIFENQGVTKILPQIKPQKTVGEDLFLTNVMPIKQNDPIPKKIGKGAVNFAVSTLSAPGELLRHTSIGIGNVATGQGGKPIPKNTSFVEDVLPKQAAKPLNTFAEKHPVVGGIAKMGIETVVDPTTWGITGGGRTLLNPEKMGITQAGKTVKPLSRATEPTSADDLFDIPAAKTTEAPKPEYAPWVREDLIQQANDQKMKDYLGPKDPFAPFKESGEAQPPYAEAMEKQKYIGDTSKRYNEIIENEVKNMKGTVNGVLKYGDMDNGYRRASINPSWYRSFYEKFRRVPTEGEYRDMAIKNLIEGNAETGEPANEQFLSILSELSRGQRLSSEWHGLQQSIRQTSNMNEPELESFISEMKVAQKEVEPAGVSRNLNRLNDIESGYRQRMSVQGNYEQYDDAVSFKRTSAKQDKEFKFFQQAFSDRSWMDTGVYNIQRAPEAFDNPEFAAANALVKANTGRDVIPFKGSNEIAGAQKGNSIFLNKDTKQPATYVALHEVGHEIKVNSPETHQRMLQIVQEHIADNEGLSSHYSKLGYTPDKVNGELLSDAFAEVGHDPSFWARVRNEAPELLKPILDTIDRIIANVKAKVGNDMTIMPYLQDLETMRNRLADEYRGYLVEQKGIETEQGLDVAAKKEGNINLKLQPQNRADELKNMVVAAAQKIPDSKGLTPDFKAQMLKDFPELADESRVDDILKYVYDRAQEARIGQTSFTVGGNPVNISKADLNIPAKGSLVGEGQKARSLGISAADAPWSTRETAEGLVDEIKPGGRGAYDPISNEQTLTDAKAAITQDRDAVVRRIMSDKPSDRIDNTAGLLLVKEANDSGNIKLAVDLTEALAKKATEAGQAIQALSMWGRLTPEGMLQYAQKVVKNTNDDLARAKNKQRIKLSEEDGKKIIDLMKQADGLEGRAKEIKTAQALEIIASQIPPSWGQRIATLQTMAQLLNPKTATRNIIGNVGFAGLENVSDVVGAGLDKGVGLITGNRSKVLPSVGTQLKGAKQGFELGLEDALLGIDTSAMKGGKFDIPQTRTFRSGPLSYLEKAMNIELRATDRAFYTAAYDESLRQQMAAAAKSKKPPTTEQMQEIAHHDALYRTFQDDSAAAQAFSTIKKGLNLGKDFGVGDFVIKYPKTPGNLLSRGIEYSPAGFIKTIVEMGKPLFGHEFNQKAFVESFSRALVGSTALVGAGALMHKMGLITGSPDKDYDIENLKAQAGFGQYKINASGLKRVILSFDPNEAKLRKGDLLVSYDWFQPNSIGLAMGADIDKNKGEKKGIVGKLGAALTFGAGGLMAGINSFAEQPVMQGVQQLFSGQDGDLATGALKIVEGVPASFMPTLLNQVKQLVDNQKRSTYSPDYLTEMGNKVKTKIPGAASNLPKSYGTLGQPLPTYQESENNLTGNNPFNVLLNPAFVSQYKPLPAAERVLDVYNKTGNSEVFPRTVKKYIEFTLRGSDQTQRIDLTSKEYSNYQRLVGEYANEKINRLSPGLPTKKEVKKIKGILDDANEKAKKDILESRGLKAKRD